MPIINSMIFGGGGSDDPFEWQSVELFAFTGPVDDCISVDTSASLYFDLPVAVDTNNYLYDFVLVNFGLVAPEKTQHELILETADGSQTQMISVIRATGEDDEITHHSVTRAYTTVSNRFEVHIWGTVDGAVKERSNILSGNFSNGIYSKVRVDFDSDATSSRGMVLLYRACEQK